jgi:cytochrome c oxidase subunit 2
MNASHRWSRRGISREINGRIDGWIIGTIVLGALLSAGCHGADASRTATPAAPTEQGTEHVVRITAKRFEYSPSSIQLKKGEPVVLELVSLDRVHGFNAPDFGLRADVKPGESTRLRFVPDKVGTFEFHCDVFCGSGHEDMSGEFVIGE